MIIILMLNKRDKKGETKMKTALVGYTGFVGSNLLATMSFDNVYNSKNIHEIEQEEFDLVIYSGVRAEKFLANQHPEQDFAHIQDTIENIKKIKTKQFVLISTVDVYKNPMGVDENTPIIEEDLHPYGLNRRYLEKWVEEHIPNALIVRLPALYGINLKTNFLYDLKTIVPSMLKKEKLESLAETSSLDLENYYELKSNGFYGLRADLTSTHQTLLKAYFSQNDFNALSFTDSRNAYSFYHLKDLSRHIQLALDKGIRLLNLGTEPLSTNDIYQAVKGDPFINEIISTPVVYDIRTRYAQELGGAGFYLTNKTDGLNNIVEFLK